MIGREKTGNNRSHRAEGIEHSVRPVDTMPFALCAMQFNDWSE